ncbi:MAG: transcription antitermination factor NusB [Christensenellaceae bacterium]
MITLFYDCYNVLNKVYSDGAYISQAINGTQVERLKIKQITKICYGVLDKDVELSYYVKFLTEKNPKLSVRTILKISMYCIKYLNKQPYAVTNSAVELAKKLGKSGAKGFINAFLRNFINKPIPLPTDPIENLSVKYSYPSDALKYLIESYGADTAEKIIAYDEEHSFARFASGFNGEEYLTENKIEYRKTVYSDLFDVKGLALNDDFKNGVFTFQSIGSVAICEAVDSGELLLDCCSAPGGKAVLLSGRFKKVVANDIHEHRCELIKSYAERMHVDNISVAVQDGALYNSEYDGVFDTVLCDAPCSGYGTLKDNPDIKLHKRFSDLVNLTNQQLAILNNVSEYVKIGGYLVYSTCSPFDVENDKIIDKFLKNHANYELVKIKLSLENVTTEYGNQFLPHISLGQGFYVSKLRRIK